MKSGVRLLWLGSVVSVRLAAAQANPIPADLFHRPDGPFAIGTHDYLWVDEKRPEILTKDPSDRRHLMVQIWYPAEAVEGIKPAPYIRNPDEFGDFPGFKPVLHVVTNAISDAPVSKAHVRYPVLIYNHGGSWTRFSATFTTEMMASHGYVVVSIDHTGFDKTSLFPDGYRFRPDTLGFPATTGKLREDALANWDYLERVLFTQWVDDARFVLDQLETLNRTKGQLLYGRLDLDRVGMFGWSFGGATSIQMSKTDPRVKAAVDQDGQLFGTVDQTGTDRPVMLMHNGDDNAQAGDANKEIMAELMGMVEKRTRSLLDRSSNDWYEVTIAKTTHGHFSDLMLFYPTPVGKLDPRRAHEIINAYTLAFFDKYLKGQDSELLKASPSPYSEVTFKKK